MDWPFPLGQLLLPQPHRASRGPVTRQQGWQGGTQEFVPTHVPEPSSCQSTTRCVQELRTSLILRDANPIRKGGFTAELGGPCSTVVGRDALHTSASSLTPRLHGESCLPNPQACVLCFFACTVQMLVDDNWGICVFAAMDRYQLLSHLSPKFNSLYFEKST